ncbi:hypothetical protein ACWM35_15905 [Neobacillus sp. K501]
MNEQYEKSNLYKITKASLSDIPSMLELNYKIYPAEWHVSEDYVMKIMKKNPEVYNVLNTDMGTKGIFSLFPLKKETYDSILKGELEESDLSEYILDYQEPKDVYLYLISLIVDIHDGNRKQFAKKIIQGIPEELRRLAKKGINVKEIGAIAISLDGEAILPKIGFNKDEDILALHNHKYPVFRASIEEITRAIVI